MRFVFFLFSITLFGCSSGEHTDVQTPGGADTLQLQADSASGSRVDGTSVDGATDDTPGR